MSRNSRLSADRCPQDGGPCLPGEGLFLQGDGPYLLEGDLCHQEGGQVRQAGVDFRLRGPAAQWDPLVKGLCHPGVGHLTETLILLEDLLVHQLGNTHLLQFTEEPLLKEATGHPLLFLVLLCEGDRRYPPLDLQDGCPLLIEGHHLHLDFLQPNQTGLLHHLYVPGISKDSHRCLQFQEMFSVFLHLVDRGLQYHILGVTITAKLWVLLVGFLRIPTLSKDLFHLTKRLSIPHQAGMPVRMIALALVLLLSAYLQSNQMKGTEEGSPIL